MNRIRVISWDQIFELLDSKFRTLMASGPFPGIEEEWRVILDCFNTMLAPHGSEPWEFVLMMFAPEIPVFNVCFNLKSLTDCVDWDLLESVLATLRLPWVIQIEFYDMIDGTVMSGGDKIREAVVADGALHVWDA